MFSIIVFIRMLCIIKFINVFFSNTEWYIIGYLIKMRAICNSSAHYYTTIS